MKSNTKQYLKVTAFIWSCCIIVFVLVFLLVLLPQRREKNRIENEYRKIESSASEAFLAAQEQTKDRLKEHIKELNERLGDFVIVPGSTSNLTYEISGISNKLGLNSFQVAPVGESIMALDDCKYISGQFFNVSFTASFSKFANFLNVLERYRPFIYVDTFSITRSRQDSMEHDIHMQLAVLVAKNEKAEDVKG
jgi:hypothetical protein